MASRTAPALLSTLVQAIQPGLFVCFQCAASSAYARIVCGTNADDVVVCLNKPIINMSPARRRRRCAGNMLLDTHTWIGKNRNITHMQICARSCACAYAARLRIRCDNVCSESSTLRRRRHIECRSPTSSRRWRLARIQSIVRVFEQVALTRIRFINSTFRAKL